MDAWMIEFAEQKFVDSVEMTCIVGITFCGDCCVLNIERNEARKPRNATIQCHCSLCDERRAWR